MYRKNSGFTLVELAIVITIIGLLIGGVLKGQELLENARMTSTQSQIKSYEAATNTFKDIYKALPGDIVNPANFIQNCTTSPCNISGDNNGILGFINSSASDENFNYWLHMAKAGVVAGVDPNMTWTSSTWHKATPKTAIGTNIKPSYLSAPSFWNYYPTPLQGFYYEMYQSDATGSNGTGVLRQSQLMKLDLKIDDGKPLTGDVRILATNATYDPNDNALYSFVIKAGF